MQWRNASYRRENIKLNALMVKGILSFLVACSILSGTYSFAKENSDYKKIYKDNVKAIEKSPEKYKSTKNKEHWLPFTRAVKKKEDVNKIPKNSFMMKGIPKGRPSSEEKYKKDAGIKPASKKNWLMTGLAKTGKHGVKESDIKGSGTKPYTKQVVPLDTIKKKDMKDLKVKKLH